MLYNIIMRSLTLATRGQRIFMQKIYHMNLLYYRFMVTIIRNFLSSAQIKISNFILVPLKSFLFSFFHSTIRLLIYGVFLE